VFFKHKYITQPTVTPADAIVNAFTKLQDAINGLQHSRNDAHFDALQRIGNLFQFPSKQITETGEKVTLPTMDNQIEPIHQPPRVHFDDRLIVASPTKPTVDPPPKFIDDSIAARVRARRLQSQTAVGESIADRVTRRRREAAHAVLDQDTGELLEY
jgi:hypothetical protein